MLTNNKQKINIIVPLVACLFMIAEKVLQIATVVPVHAQMPTRFFIYYGLKAVTLVGMNLIPLYLGYHVQKFDQQPLKHLAKYWLIYTITALLSTSFFFALKGQLSLRDVWVVLFPISQNYFGYSVACVLLYLALPYLEKHLKTLSMPMLNLSIVLATVVFSGLPTLFGKDIWRFQDGYSVIWLVYLFGVGFFLKKREEQQPISFRWGHLFISLFLLTGMIVLMTNISLLLRGDTSTANRFSVPYSLLAVYYSVSLFLCLEKLQKIIPVQWQKATLATYLISTQVVINWPVIIYQVQSFYKKDFPDSGMKWLLNSLLFIAIYQVAAVSLTVLSLFLQKIGKYQKLENKLSIQDYSQLKQLLLDFPNWLKKKKRLFLLIGFFYGMTLLQMYLVSDHYINITVSRSVNAYLYIFFARQGAIVLNVIILMAFFYLLFLITNRFWYAFTFTLVVDIVLTISNVLKISMREEPILPADLTLIAGMNEVFNMISPVVLIGGGLFLVVLAISSWLIQKKMAKLYALKLNRKKRVIRILCLCLFFSGAFWVNHKNTLPYHVFNVFKINRYFYNQKLGAQINGPLVQFINNIDTKVMDEPEGYSQQAIEEIMKKYDKEAAHINQTRTAWPSNQTIIFNLSESFSDPKRIPNLKVREDPMPYIRQLEKETTSGVMLSTGYGGGTANIEWETLTGLDLSSLSPTLPTPYTQLVKKQQLTPNVTDLFDEKIAIHPYVATLYNRKNVFKKFGFDRFLYDKGPDKLNYQERLGTSPYISDESAYRDTLKVIKENQSSSQFIQLSTMQNHMPYDGYYDGPSFNFEGTAVLDGRKEEMETYMQGLFYTDQAVKEFIAELDRIDKPITLVWYGDHLPSLYTGNPMSKYGLVQHQTDYFIYSNAYSRKMSEKLDKQIVSPHNFPALALAQANLQVTPYYALLTKISENLPATTTNPMSSVSNSYNGLKVFVTDKDQFIQEEELTAKQQKLFNEYQLIQYDLTAGNEYAAEWASQGIS